MCELFVIGAFIVIALTCLNAISFTLGMFGGDNLVEQRKKGNSRD